MQFCNKCKLKNAAVDNAACVKCGLLKKSEIKTSKDYVVWIGGNSKIAEYLKLEKTGSYDLSNKNE